MNFGIDFDKDKKQYILFFKDKFYNNNLEYSKSYGYEVIHILGYYDIFEDAIEAYRMKLKNIFESIN